MRIWLLIGFVCLLSTSVLAAGDPASDAYRKSDYATARGLWLNALEEAESSSERGRILYNLGNATFREGDTRRAVGWYTAALRYVPRDADVWSNLEFARSEAGLEPADRGDLTATLERLLSSWTPAESEWLWFGSLGLLAILLFMEAFRGGVVWRRLSWIGFVLVLLSSCPWFYGKLQARRDAWLVVASKSVPVRSEPRDEGTKIESIEPGLIVERTGELPDWIEVELEEGTQGWLPRESVFQLKR